MHKTGDVDIKEPNDGNKYAPVDVRMIDFEHSTYKGFRDDPVHEGVDEGYILGLTNLIKIFDDMLIALQQKL